VTNEYLTKRIEELESMVRDAEPFVRAGHKLRVAFLVSSLWLSRYKRLFPGGKS
jgi:hypothetical protein